MFWVICTRYKRGGRESSLLCDFVALKCLLFVICRKHNFNGSFMLKRRARRRQQRRGCNYNWYFISGKVENGKKPIKTKWKLIYVNHKLCWEECSPPEKKFCLEMWNLFFLSLPLPFPSSFLRPSCHKNSFCSLVILKHQCDILFQWNLIRLWFESTTLCRT